MNRLFDLPAGALLAMVYRDDSGDLSVFQITERAMFARDRFYAWQEKRRNYIGPLNIELCTLFLGFLAHCGWVMPWDSSQTDEIIRGFFMRAKETYYFIKGLDEAPLRRAAFAFTDDFEKFLINLTLPEGFPKIMTDYREMHYHFLQYERKFAKLVAEIRDFNFIMSLNGMPTALSYPKRTRTDIMRWDLGASEYVRTVKREWYRWEASGVDVNWGSFTIAALTTGEGGFIEMENSPNETKQIQANNDSTDKSELPSADYSHPIHTAPRTNKSLEIKPVFGGIWKGKKTHGKL